MNFLFIILEMVSWVLLLIPVIKKQELEAEECRKYCKYGCTFGVLTTICFLAEMKRRNDMLMNGDVSQQLMGALLSITWIPLGIYMIIFLFSRFRRR